MADSARARVSLVKAADYRPEVIGPAVAQLLGRLEPLPLPRGGRILLKPNCLSSHHDPEAEVNTRAEVVEAVGRYLIDNYQARLVIADSAGMGSYGRSRRAYARIGLDKVAERLEAELIDIDGRQAGLTELTSPTGLVLAHFRATDLLTEIDAVVNLPKFKTHLLTGLTGAVKNCLGLLPGGLKRGVHVTAPNSDRLSRAMVDIYAAVRPALTIMDAVIGMEGAGPAQGKPRPVGRLLASTDGVALDAVVATMMGLRPDRVVTVAEAGRTGVGQGTPEAIDLLGADWAELPVPGFKKAFSGFQSYLTRLLPRGQASRLVDWATEARPRIDHSRCRACGECVATCPAQALSLSAQKLSLDKTRCIECYCCLEHCPAEGLWVPRNLRQKILSRRPAAR